MSALAIGAVAVAALLLEALIAPSPAVAETVIPAPDGLTEETAAASCWEIKQNDSEAESGTYWIATPAMGGAEQFYCDQEREGGGWVLIGRGREAWSVSNTGSGSPEQVREEVTGPAAFVPRQLSSELIGQLVNDERIDSLDDGIRLVRAQNTNGTQWHDMTFKLSTPRADWTWQFNNEQRVGNYRIGSQSFSGGTTANFGRNNNYDRVRTITGSYEGWHMGFGFGSNIRGQNNSTSHIWSKNTSTGYARPFTQVFIRPKLMSADVYSAIPNDGTEAVTGTDVADSFALPQSWGVAGLGAGPASIEGSNEVSAFAESNGKVFVGGNFTTVQRSAGGSGAQQQPYLTAFDQDTGEWVPGFRPTFNNQVKAIAAMPGGRIAVGGYFTQVNGEPRAGLVVLNAQTGEIDAGFTGRLINYLSGGSAVVVRSLDVQDGWLYAGGTFTHSTGGTESREVYTRAAARFAVADGTAHQPWNPELNGTVVSLDASDRGDRVYFAGYFTESKGRSASKGAAIAVDSEQLFPWPVVISSSERSGYQQAVLEVGDRVWLGGSEHSLFSYSRDDFSLLSTTIGKAGGDFQAIASDGNVVYGGCHCFETQYEGARNWPNVGSSWTEANAIDGTGAWSAATGNAIPAFSGNFNTRNGAGAWALLVDSGGTLWQGGDYTYSERQGHERQWSGGFIRHAPRDTSAPTAPGGLQAAADPEGVTLTWNSADDDRGVTAYEVLRHDRVVATVTETTARLQPVPADTRYFVRAVDAQGNKSGSTAAAVAEEVPEPPESDVLIAPGSTWSYLYGSTPPDGDWLEASFDDSDWLTGEAPFGWGHTGLGTVLDAPSPKPIVSMYRHTFELSTDSDVESVEITTRADDGLVLFVNGTEVERVRVDDGPFGVGTYANAAVNAAHVLANPVTVTVPRDVLIAGTNVVTASVHSNYRSTPSHSFELEAVATLGGGGEPLPEPPEEPEPSQLETIVGAGSSWSYLYGSTAPEEDWMSVGFDDSDWDEGNAPLGWGHSGIDTVLDAPAPKPIVSLHRNTFDIEPGTAIEEVEITTRADDGLVLFVNGTEVERVRVDDGPFGVGTYANAAVNAAHVLANPVTVTVPGEMFVAGTNVIAASVHSNYRATSSHSFELEAVALLGGAPLAARPQADPETQQVPEQLMRESAPPESTDVAPTPETDPKPEPEVEPDPSPESNPALPPESAGDQEPEPRRETARE
ncbi:MAG: fibrinogen-like YCDxxxxGGGW domain-containing protein [Leucobacter sp.]